MSQVIESFRWCADAWRWQLIQTYQGGKIDVASGKEEDLRGGAKPNSMSFFSGKLMPRNDSMLLADYY